MGNIIQMAVHVIPIIKIICHCMKKGINFKKESSVVICPFLMTVASVQKDRHVPRQSLFQARISESPINVSC